MLTNQWPGNPSTHIPATCRRLELRRQPASPFPAESQHHMEMSPQLPGSDTAQCNLGTHSLRKGAATYSSRCGVQKDYLNRRGQWRTRKAIVDVYIDNNQPLPDAVAAGSLTGPLRPCFYLLREGMQFVSTEILTDKVAHITKQVLGSEYTEAGGDRLANPVNRVGVYIVGDGAQLQRLAWSNVDGAANELLGNGDSATMHQTGASLSMATDSSRKEFAALQMRLFRLKSYLTGVTDEILRLRTEMQRENAKLLAVTRRIAAQPILRSRPKNVANQNVPARSECSDQSGNQSGHQQVARLSKRPRDLYEL
ncbi:unnamed protein product [Phytophthora lilii]|uniref:Unnamed protein product n=1 Tax=Phytophthora lilii TaxID=2077276 RepID=A0A9W6XAB0_9STRA|nr:unnamed protein product [Phytophthora lilii]